MEIIEMLLKEMDAEAVTTRKFLKLVPMDKPDWQPHPKSMKLMPLVTHIAELPGWVSLTIITDELDFAKEAYVPKVVKSTDELLKLFEDSLTSGRAELAKTDEQTLAKNWKLRSGEAIYFSAPKVDMIRTAYSQIVHHRAQLGVYLRLLDIPIPGSYGPSADDMSM